MTTPSFETTLMPIFTADQARELVQAFAKINSITAQSNSTATLNSTIIVNGEFTSNLNSWTSTGWTWSAGTALHTAGNTNALSQSVPVVNGTLYLISYDIVGVEPLAGDNTIYVNGVKCPSYNSLETDQTGSGYTSYVATSTGNVTFEVRPSTAFIGAYGYLRMQPIAVQASPVFEMKDSSGSPFMEFLGTAAQSNLGIGLNTLRNNVGGANNVGMGRDVFADNIEGYENAALGNFALSNNTAGYGCVGVGHNALVANTAGLLNTAVGADSCASNIGGSYNTACGRGTLHNNVEGISNVAIGVNALYTTLGNYNIGIGSNALGAAGGSTGTHNNAIGIDCARSMTSGQYNQAMGYETMFANQTGTGNDAYGHQALYTNVSGSYNAGFGYQTLASSTGSDNTALGAGAGANQTAGSGNILIGRNANAASLTGSNQLNIGNTIYGDLANDKIGIGRVPNSKFAVLGLPVYANNAAAIVGGLTAGDMYRTGADPDPVCVVH